MIHWRPYGTEQPAQVGFIVSKSVGMATVRNKVRRRLQHVITDRYSMIPIGSTFVVRALPPAAGSTFNQLDADLHRALQRVSSLVDRQAIV